MDDITRANMQGRLARFRKEREAKRLARDERLKQLESEEVTRRESARKLAKIQGKSVVEAQRFVTKPHEKRAREVAKCERIQRKAWKQFCRSCEDKVVVTVKEVVDKHGDIHTLETTQRTGQAGDPSLLRVIINAMERAAALQGLDLALARQPASPVTVNIGAMSDDDLLAIAKSNRAGFMSGTSGAGVIETTSCPVEPSGLHAIHEARLLGPVVSQGDGGCP